jgi:hypothetical protein
MDGLIERIKNISISKDEKTQKGIFLTTNAENITHDMSIPDDVKIIEPCVGNGDLLRLINNHHVESYDIRDMSNLDIFNKSNISFTVRDILKNPPSYENKFVLANPPYLARNKATDKKVFNIYNENDLYKCFIKTLINDNPIGGILIIPLNFWCSVRKSDINLRKLFISKFNIIRFNMFKTQTFDDTTYTICSFQFEKSIGNGTGIFDIVSDDGMVSHIKLSQNNNWIIGGEIFQLSNIGFSRATKKNIKEHNTCLNVYCIDNKEKIRMEYSQTINFVDNTKNLTSRSFMTIVSPITLTMEEQKHVSLKWNEYLNIHRNKYQSLFLPNYRDKFRKRIPFDLVYKIISHVIQTEYPDKIQKQ